MRNVPSVVNPSDVEMSVITTSRMTLYVWMSWEGIITYSNEILMNRNKADKSGTPLLQPQKQS